MSLRQSGRSSRCSTASLLAYSGLWGWRTWMTRGSKSSFGVLVSLAYNYQCRLGTCASWLQFFQGQSWTSLLCGRLFQSRVLGASELLDCLSLVCKGIVGILGVPNWLAKRAGSSILDLYPQLTYRTQKRQTMRVHTNPPNHSTQATKTINATRAWQACHVMHVSLHT